MSSTTSTAARRGRRGRRRGRGRFGLLVTVAAAAALTGPLAGPSAASTAHQATAHQSTAHHSTARQGTAYEGTAYQGTAYQGTWTVSHGGTGQLSLEGDGSYTSTCRRLPTFPLAQCPAPSGTYRTTSGPHGIGTALAFDGSDGSTVNLTWAFGDWPTPVSLAQDAPDWNGLIAYAGSTFTCSTFFDSTASFVADGPMVTTNRRHTHAFALGSHQKLGAVSTSTWVTLSETAPGYFVKGFQPGCVW